MLSAILWAFAALFIFEYIRLLGQQYAVLQFFEKPLQYFAFILFLGREAPLTM